MQQHYRFQLLAPPETSNGGTFGRHHTSKQLYDHFLASIQKLRGRIYLRDGAIQEPELDEERRFCMAGDKRSWHLLLIDGSQKVIGGARYLVHPNTVSFDHLRVRHSGLAKDPVWAPRVRHAVEEQLDLARVYKFSYVEIGGWVLSEEWRGTRAALEMVVASYALAHSWGGCLGACTATARHGSSSILRRIGGSSFDFAGEPLPAYEDPQYGCQMELLRFDYRTPCPRFAPLIGQLRAKLANATVLHGIEQRTWHTSPAWALRRSAYAMA